MNESMEQLSDDLLENISGGVFDREAVKNQKELLINSIKKNKVFEAMQVTYALLATNQRSVVGMVLDGLKAECGNNDAYKKVANIY